MRTISTSLAAAAAASGVAVAAAAPQTNAALGMQPGSVLSLAATVVLCRAGGEGAPAQAGGGKRRLLAVSTTFRLPGDAVPAHMMFGTARGGQAANAEKAAAAHNRL